MLFAPSGTETRSLRTQEGKGGTLTLRAHGIDGSDEGKIEERRKREVADRAAPEKKRTALALMSLVLNSKQNSWLSWCSEQQTEQPAYSVLRLSERRTLAQPVVLWFRTLFQQKRFRTVPEVT